MGGVNLPAEFEESWFIRVVTPDAAKNWLRGANAGREDTALYIGASQLKGAYDARDEYVLRQAYEKLQPYVRGIPSPEPIEVNLGTTKKGAKIALRSGGQNLGTARDAYSGLMTALFQSARFVMWFSEKDGRFLPLCIVLIGGPPPSLRCLWGASVCVRNAARFSSRQPVTWTIAAYRPKRTAWRDSVGGQSGGRKRQRSLLRNSGKRGRANRARGAVSSAP